MFPKPEELPKIEPLLEARSSVLPRDEIDFLGYSESYFICFIDIVNSTNIVATISDSHAIRKYYAIFLNSLSKIAHDYGGKTVKNAGDSLILYFPDTSDPLNSDAFKKAMGCCFEMIGAHHIMNLLTNYENLPKIDYRISADYGKVEVAKSRSSTDFDLIGHTMNMCAKMNSRAKPQGLVIGGDLYEVLKRFKFTFSDRYDFQPIGEYSAGLRYNYPIFAVRTKSDIADRPTSDLSINQAHAPQSIRHRIMIVDDEPDVLLTYKTMLEDESLFEVETYTSSQDALQRLLSNGLSSYDLVITDVRMPAPNGLQLYNIIKSLNKQTRVLFITAYDIIEEVVSVLPDVTREHVLKKPISKPDLVREARLCMV